jgi:hypothetical protein
MRICTSQLILLNARNGWGNPNVLSNFYRTNIPDQSSIHLTPAFCSQQATNRPTHKAMLKSMHLPAMEITGSPPLSGVIAIVNRPIIPKSDQMTG